LIAEFIFVFERRHLNQQFASRLGIHPGHLIVSPAEHDSSSGKLEHSHLCRNQSDDDLVFRFLTIAGPMGRWTDSWKHSCIGSILRCICEGHPRSLMKSLGDLIDRDRSFTPQVCKERLIVATELPAMLVISNHLLTHSLHEAQVSK